MIKAIFRKAFANIRSHRLQTVVVFIILTLATTVLALAVAVQRAAANPWQHTFDETQGAHIWFSSKDKASLAATADLEGVTGTAGPFRVINASPKTRLVESQQMVALYGRPANLEQQIGQVLIVDGRWYAAGKTDEIVLERLIAEKNGLGVGDLVTVQHGGQQITAKIVGLAYNPALLPCPFNTGAGICTMAMNNVVYMLPETLNSLEPDEMSGTWIQGVRLADADSADYAKTVNQNSLPEGVEMGAITWIYLRERQVDDVQFNQVVLTVFSLFGLGLAGFILINVSSGQILSEYREIALLKSIGFQPRDISLIYLMTQITLAGTAALAGIALAQPLVPTVVGRAAEVLNATGSNVMTPPLYAAVALITIAVVTLFTFLPVRQAGQVNTAQAIAAGYAPPTARPSFPARLAGWLRLPPVVVLGVKDAFARPFRAVLTILVIAIGVTALTFAMSVETTIQNVFNNPSILGYFPVDIQMSIFNLPSIGSGESEPVDTADIRTLLESNSAVASFISYGSLRGVNQADKAVYDIQAVGDDLSLMLPAVEGGQITADGEAMVNRLAADEKGVGVGDELTLLVGDKSVTLNVVGIYIEGDSEQPSVATTIATLLGAGIPVEVNGFGVKAVSTEASATLAQELDRATSSRVFVESISQSVAEDVIEIRGVTYLLNVALLTIVAANVLATATLTVRERLRDLATMKMLGMTPRQVTRSVTSGSLVLALIAVMVGIPLGLVVTKWLIIIISENIGLQQGIARLPDLLWLSFIVPITLLIVAVGSALPARQAGRLAIAESFRME